MLDSIDRCAAVLRAGGICAGDRVGFLGFNQPSFIYTMFGASRLGATFVPLNFRLTGPELSFIISDAGIHTIVVDCAHHEVIDGIRGEIPVRVYLGADHGEPGWIALESLLADHDAVAVAEPVDPESVAVIMYTSGTTGRPKGAMLTHANLWWNNAMNMHAYDTLATDVTLVCMPLFHIGGLNCTTLVTWQKGGEVVLHRSFDPGAVLEAIERHRVNTMIAVPAMFLFMSQHPAFEPTDLTSIRLFLCGGAPVPDTLIKLYSGRGIPFQQGYGMTETAPFISLLGAEYASSKVGSAGRPPLFVDMRLVDPSGTTVSEPHTLGEICVKGPNVMRGYWNRPDANAVAFDSDGWFHTGDAGYLDEDGFLYVTDRVKDMVISGGENVYPAEIENVLYEHPAIGEVAVIGLPDERWGEAVVAVVAPKEGATVTLKELREFAGQSLAGYKLPTRLFLIDALPRNPTGKVLKFQLRERFSSILAG
jgi:fatty-acyl-CoA synthase